MIIGIDIGGTNIDIVSYSKKFKHLATFNTKESLLRLKNLIDFSSATAIGIGAAVWIKKGKIVHAPNLPEKKLEFEFNVPVFLDNDANCFALFASKKLKSNNLLAITIGTGIGAGIIADGKIIKGEGIAGEIGHSYIGGKKRCVCGGVGHLECYFSGWSLKQSEKLIKNRKIYENKGFELFCKSVASCIMLLDPEFVVFGGRIGANLDEKILKQGIYKYLASYFKPKIRSINDPFSVAKGACYLALENL